MPVGLSLRLGLGCPSAQPCIMQPRPMHIDSRINVRRASSWADMHRVRARCYCKSDVIWGRITWSTLNYRIFRLLAPWHEGVPIRHDLVRITLLQAYFLVFWNILNRSSLKMQHDVGSHSTTLSIECSNEQDGK